MAQGEGTYLTSSEVARTLQVSPRTVNRWADAGWIRCTVTLGRHRRFSPAEVERVAAQMALSQSAGAGPGTPD